MHPAKTLDAQKYGAWHRSPKDISLPSLDRSRSCSLTEDLLLHGPTMAFPSIRSLSKFEKTERAPIQGEGCSEIGARCLSPKDLDAFRVSENIFRISFCRMALFFRSKLTFLALT